MRAILGDIHGNLEALQAVLADVERHGATEIFCVGGLAGYGPIQSGVSNTPCHGTWSR